MWMLEQINHISANLDLLITQQNGMLIGNHSKGYQSVLKS
jgi:hypothetical protein